MTDEAVIAAMDALTGVVPPYADGGADTEDRKAARLKNEATRRLCWDAAVAALKEAAHKAETTQDHVLVADTYRNFLYLL